MCLPKNFDAEYCLVWDVVCALWDNRFKKRINVDAFMFLTDFICLVSLKYFNLARLLTTLLSVSTICGPLVEFPSLLHSHLRCPLPTALRKHRELRAPKKDMNDSRSGCFLSHTYISPELHFSITFEVHAHDNMCSSLCGLDCFLVYYMLRKVYITPRRVSR